VDVDVDGASALTARCLGKAGEQDDIRERGAGDKGGRRRRAI
jgi:hypothetical protein